MNGTDETQNINSMESDLHRTPRMFSLTEQASSLESHGKGAGSDETKCEESKNDSGDQANDGDNATATEPEKT